jgi:hypothetical protein
MSLNYIYIWKGRTGPGNVTQFWGIPPELYLSKELDQVAKEWLQAVTAVSLLLPEAQKLTLNCCPLTVYTSHDVGGILNSKGEL